MSTDDRDAMVADLTAQIIDKLTKSGALTVMQRNVVTGCSSTYACEPASFDCEPGGFRCHSGSSGHFSCENSFTG